ncbi:MAG: hypothetical protein HY866_21220 [Chloroflexi bacterium]|nr:hypothetical protein [Chloroflexota bacterium]
MGFFEQQGSTAKNLPVTVLLAGFQAQCILQVMGILQTFLNDEQKAVFALKQVALHGLEVDNPAASMSLPELYVRKEECHAIAFDRMFEKDDTGLMPRPEQVAVYTSHYAIQGQFHMGSDTPISDFIASSKSPFVVATDAYIFPLFQPQAALIQTAPLVFVYRSAVRMHHPM